MPRKNNRQPVIELPVPGIDFFSDVTALYDVTMTNGSGVRHLLLSGSQRSCWTWACRAGEQPGELLGFVPVDLIEIEPAPADEPFVALV
jgi:hypothetical protein